MWLQSFDSGLLGEGVLHMLALANQKVLTEDAMLMPAADQAVYWLFPFKKREEVSQWLA